MLNKILQISFVPILFKIINIAVFLILITIGFSTVTNDSSLFIELRNTNAANLIVWSYWWPLIIIFSILLGRVWCFVCPVETITTLSSKIGLKRKVPNVLKTGWAMTIFYTVILFIGIHGFAIHRDPFKMAIYLLSLIIISIISGLLFEKNAFCSYLCPVGHLLGIYSRLSPFGWRVGNADVCKTCKDKSCISKAYIYNPLTKSCGVGLYPAGIENNEHCILCTGCMKACRKYISGSQESRPNPGYRFLGFKKILTQKWDIKPAIAFFILIVSGFVIYEILTEWQTSKIILLYVPNIIKNFFIINNPIAFGFIKSILLFILLPLILIIIPYLMSPLTRNKIGFKKYVLFYLPSIIPIMAAAHISKALLKMSSRIPYFSYLSNDIIGINTAEKIISHTIRKPDIPYQITFSLGIIIPIMLIISIVISFFMVYDFNKRYFLDKKPIALYLLPVLYGAILFTTIIVWKFIA